MTPDSIAVVDGNDLERLSADLAWAVQNNCAVRFTVDGGLKYDAADGTGWTPPLGRTGNTTGQ